MTFELLLYRVVRRQAINTAFISWCLHLDLIHMRKYYFHLSARRTSVFCCQGVYNCMNCILDS